MISASVFGLGFVASVAFILEGCIKAESCWASGYEEPFAFQIQKLSIGLWALSILVLTTIILTLRKSKRIK